MPEGNDRKASDISVLISTKASTFVCVNYEAKLSRPACGVNALLIACVIYKVFLYVCVCIYIYIYTHTHTHTHVCARMCVCVCGGGGVLRNGQTRNFGLNLCQCKR
jgi:hypothetical protein